MNQQSYKSQEKQIGFRPFGYHDIFLTLGSNTFKKVEKRGAVWFCRLAGKKHHAMLIKTMDGQLTRSLLSALTNLFPHHSDIFPQL